MSHLNYKTALITGAACGIGAQLTQDFLKNGAHVIACDIDLEKLQLRYKNQANCTIVKLNVTDYSNWKEALSAVDSLDYLINVAGVIRPGYIGETEKNAIDQQIDINLKGSIYGSQLYVEKMTPKGYGHIINFASMAGIAPIPGISIYSASKFGVRGFSLAIANELKEKNIAVSVICPDATDTHMLDDQMNSKAAAMTFSAEKILTVEEISKVVLEEVLDSKKQEVWIPFHRGVQAYLGATFPKLASWMSKILIKQGLEKQEKFRNSRN